MPRKEHLDPVTEFFVLAWDAFESPQFPADEALKLARVVGVPFDEQLRDKILEIKGGDVILWDSATRMKKGSVGSSRMHEAPGAIRTGMARRNQVSRASMGGSARRSAR